MLDEAEAVELADEIMTAFAEGDFAISSSHWSPAMRSAIPAADWSALRDATLAVGGDYLGITTAELTAADTAGMVRWEFVADFLGGRSHAGDRDASHRHRHRGFLHHPGRLSRR